MRRARENVSVFGSHTVLKRLLDGYENFDTARRLCIDYCIVSNDIARLCDEIPRPRRSKSRLIFTLRSNRIVDEAYLLAR
jgi:hypothetical protein